jgi:hypothetical protein
MPRTVQENTSRIEQATRPSRGPPRARLGPLSNFDTSENFQQDDSSFALLTSVPTIQWCFIVSLGLELRSQTDQLLVVNAFERAGTQLNHWRDC